MSSPEDAGGIGVEFVDDDVDRLAGLEVEVLGPLAVAVTEIEGPEPRAFVAELCDRHRGPIAGRAAPHRTLLVDGDVLASYGHLEADLVLELVGDAAATRAPNPLDIDVGEGAARHALRLRPQPPVDIDRVLSTTRHPAAATRGKSRGVMGSAEPASRIHDDFSQSFGYAVASSSVMEAMRCSI